MANRANVGLIGLAVMGENLVMNLESKGYSVAVYDRYIDVVERFMAGRGKGKAIIGCHSMKELIDSLETPRKVILLIKAGSPVDDCIDQLIPLMEKGDCIIDSGNSYFKDTIRRTGYVESKGLLYIGTGISGGEEGALKGPSMMPGGSIKAWPLIKNILQTVSAKVDGNIPCCDWVGSDGAGHFVKMVHNGIEYGDMQLISEAYHLMKQTLGLSEDEISHVFEEWNKTELDSYLIEITSKILKKKDADDTPLVSKILDSAGQKGTGRWVANTALEAGVPLSLITESVFSRSLSCLKEERVAASAIYNKPVCQFDGDKTDAIEEIRKALLASKIISYAQGFALMKKVSDEYSWGLKYGELALMWRGGCIIRSTFLGKIKEAFDRDPELSNLVLDPYFKDLIAKLLPSWRQVVAKASLLGVPIPAFSSSLSYFDGYTSAKLPANLIQAQRDFFGAHTYERVDKERGQFFHTNWTGEGGTTSSTSYNA